MITNGYLRTMARYNIWQNASIYKAASELTDVERNADRGAFFKSIHATLNHLLWADRMWLSRFGAAPPPEAKSIAAGLTAFPEWHALVAERQRFDSVIEQWADDLKPEDLHGDLTWYSAAAGRELTQPRAFLMTHIFNHQTHHRGQVHAMLTALGKKPDITDLPFGPPLHTYAV